ncbi:MAG TPA: histidine phosphatase family protein [Armatimonadota bacterium]|jgi:broad specificity phosphatase PhoE
MAHLILVKHSLVTVDPDVPRESWPLSEEGRRRCVPLAEALAAFAPTVLVSSLEGKAQQNAELIAPRLGLPVTVVEGLHENDRRGLPVVSTSLFRKRMAMFFKDWHERVMGMESAEEALLRFDTAVRGVVDAHPGETIVIIAHGAVIALFVAAHNQCDPFPYWQTLDLPSMAILTLPDFQLQETVARVE